MQTGLEPDWDSRWYDNMVSVQSWSLLFQLPEVDIPSSISVHSQRGGENGDSRSQQQIAVDVDYNSSVGATMQNHFAPTGNILSTIVLVIKQLFQLESQHIRMTNLLSNRHYYCQISLAVIV